MTEALAEAARSRMNLAISDIARSAETESGLDLPGRLEASGYFVPTIFYVSRVLPDPRPAGVVGVTRDPATLLKLVLDTLVDAGVMRS